MIYFRQMLTATHLEKYYGNLHVLKGVDISIGKGEIVSIVGSSGAGKSTLLHILGTLDNADKGEVVLNNQRIDKLSGKALAKFRNKHIGFIFQFHHLLPEKMFAYLDGLPVQGKKIPRKKQRNCSKAWDLLSGCKTNHTN